MITTNQVVQRNLERGPLFVRMNMTDGTTRDIAIDPRMDWFSHPNPRSDLAANSLFEAPAGSDLERIPFDLLLADEAAVSRGVGPGYEAFSVGLLEPRNEESRTEPRVSFGSIYLMPQIVGTRPVRPDSGPVEIEAYLVDWRSWGGLSGSPVFVHLPPNDGRDRNGDCLWAVMLLGRMGYR